MAIVIDRQSTSLKTKIHESSLVWEIDNFLEYPHCNISELTSEKVEFKGYDAAWELSVYPKSDDDKVALKFKMVNLPVGSEKTLLKFEVRSELTGNDMMSAANHHMGRTQGRYAEPVHDMHPAVWSHDYWPVSEKQEMWCENFIEHNDLSTNYLNAGMLKIYAEVWLKTVEVVNKHTN